MRSVFRRSSFGTLGIVAAFLGCAPRSVELEHSHAGNGGSANTSGAGGTASAGSGASANGAAAGSAGRGGKGSAGAPLGDGGPTGVCGDRELASVVGGRDLPGYTAPREPRVDAWLAAMSVGDQIVQMEGVPVDPAQPDYYDIMRSQDVTLGDGTVLRGYWYRNGARGVNLVAGQYKGDRPSDGKDYSTAYPAPSVRGASWDLDLEWRIGNAVGDETATSYNNLVIIPNLEVVRHPYWGRTQDSYGEDGYHIGRMGTAFVAGVQQNVGACAPHFVGGGVEKFRSLVNAEVDEQSLREIYARPFEAVVRDGGVACVLAAYNKVNSIKSTVNGHLLRDVLKAPVALGGFGFRGFVLSDWWAAPGDQSTPESETGAQNATRLANAGLDVEVPWTLNYQFLAGEVQSGNVAPSVVAEAAGRVLEQKERFRTTLSTDGWGLTGSSTALNGSSIAANASHLVLAEESASKSAVLLTNGTGGPSVLPIRGGTKSVAVIGAETTFSLISTTYPVSGQTFHFASDVALGDRGSNSVNADPADSVGPFAGIKAASAAHGTIEVTQGTTAADGADAELVVVVVGYTPGDEGEEFQIAAGGDRTTLSLPSDQVALVKEVLDLGTPTVIVIESGSMVSLPWLSHANRSQATIWAGYGGMRGGTALGKLLFGDLNFSGKLPFAWVGADNVLPDFKSDEKSATLGYFIGYRYYDRRIAAGEILDVPFPFGHGLSYTTFAYGNFAVPCSEVSENAVLDVTADITNTGAAAGDEVAFLFVKGPPVQGATRSVKELKSFARVALAAGTTATVHLPVRIQDLKHWSTATNAWVVDPGEYTVLVGPSGADDDLAVAGTFTVPG